MIKFNSYSEFIQEINEAKIDDISTIVGKLFQSRDIAHIVHLSTGSYEKHKALNEYYDKIVDIIDRLVETYQGMYGKITISVPKSESQDIIKYFNSLHSEINNISREDIDNDIAAILDEVLELINSTRYKLKELS